MSSNYINCVGNDLKIHVTLCWENSALCGETVRSKKEGDITYGQMFWCGECCHLEEVEDE